jgi:hypothetical protein
MRAYELLPSEFLTGHIFFPIGGSTATFIWTMKGVSFCETRPFLERMENEENYGFPDHKMGLGSKHGLEDLDLKEGFMVLKTMIKKPF